MKKPKEPTASDIKKIEDFNSFMLNAKLFIKDGDNLIMNPNPVMQGNYEYTMSKAIEDFKLSQK